MIEKLVLSYNENQEEAGKLSASSFVVYNKNTCCAGVCHEAEQKIRDDDNPWIKSYPEYFTFIILDISEV